MQDLAAAANRKYRRLVALLEVERFQGSAGDVGVGLDDNLDEAPFDALRIVVAGLQQAGGGHDLQGLGFQ